MQSAGNLRGSPSVNRQAPPRAMPSEALEMRPIIRGVSNTGMVDDGELPSTSTSSMTVQAMVHGNQRSVLAAISAEPNVLNTETLESLIAGLLAIIETAEATKAEAINLDVVKKTVQLLGEMFGLNVVTEQTAES